MEEKYEFKVSIENEDKALEFWEKSIKTFQDTKASIKMNKKTTKLVNDNSEDYDATEAMSDEFEELCNKYMNEDVDSELLKKNVTDLISNFS